MVEIPYWVQRADYSATDFGPVDVETAIRAVRSRDWRAELQFQRDRESGGLETCPPGIGFVAAYHRILHICPGSDGTALVHYHCVEPRVVLQPTILLPGFAVTVLCGATAWRLLAHSAGMLGFSLVVVTATIGLYALARTIRQVRHLSSEHSQEIVRTNPAVLSADLPEVIRRFYALDHAWLAEHMQRRTGAVRDRNLSVPGSDDGSPGSAPQAAAKVKPSAHR